MLRRFQPRGMRGRVQQVAAGAAGRGLELAGDPALVEELLAVAAGLPRRSAQVRRLQAAIGGDGRGLILDMLAAQQPDIRLFGARLSGALELEAAVPWLESNLADRDPAVREACARALGRIGGVRSADALLRAFAADLVPWFRLTVELAKAAPHMYLEQAVTHAFWAHERPALVAAMGLRNPSVGGADFLAAVPISGPRDLIAACHVLARAGAWAPVSWIAALADHPDHRVRAAAARAQRRIRSSSAAHVHVVGGSVS